MKTHLKTVLQVQLYLLVMLVLSPAYAQQGSLSGRRQNAEARAERMTLQLQKDLSLNSEQLQQVSDINLQASREIEQVQAQNLNRQERRAQIFAIQNKRKEAINVLLTPEQQLRFQQHQQQSMQSLNQQTNRPRRGRQGGQ